MKVLGIETSCDECSAAVVEDGKNILSNIVATQIPFHAPYKGVVPEIASRKHAEWIYTVVKEALDKAGMTVSDLDAVAATGRPGLLGALLVGLSFAKAFAWGRGIPFIAVDHMLAHLYAPRLITTNNNNINHEPHSPAVAGAASQTGDLNFSIHSPDLRVSASPREKNQMNVIEESVPEYPFLGLLVSGGHTIICRADNFDDITVLGATIDDAAGEAFDKVAKFFGFGYPGGAVIDAMAKTGDSGAFRFPMPNLYKGNHRYDVSYSGLKNAVINQRDQFKVKKGEIQPEDIAASFQKTAVDILLRAVFNAAEDTGLRTIVAGGGVAANSYLRLRLAERRDLRCVFPPLDLCGDNGAMIAGIGYHYLIRGDRSPLDEGASARVNGFKKIRN